MATIKLYKHLSIADMSKTRNQGKNHRHVLPTELERVIRKKMQQ